MVRKAVKVLLFVVLVSVATSIGLRTADAQQAVKTLPLPPAVAPAAPSPAPPTAQASSQQPATWSRLSTATIDLTAGRHTLSIRQADTAPDATHARRSRALRLVAKSGDIVITRIIVTYDNSQRHYEERRIALYEGERTRPINLRDEALGVAEVTILFEAVPGGGQTVLEIWSLEVAPDADDFWKQREPRSEGPGGVVIGPRSGGDDAYTSVQLLYGTTRQPDSDRIKDGRALAAFSGEVAVDPAIAGKAVLTLGRAVVTVPREREAGSLSVPEIDLGIVRVRYRRENKAKDFTLQAVDVLGRPDFTTAARQMAVAAKTNTRQALVFVHGYNVSFDDALYRTAQIAHDLAFDGAAVAYSWASRGGLFAYRHDVDAARDSRQGLADLLDLLAAEKDIDTIHLIAHSMGNNPVLDLLSERRLVADAGGRVSDLKLGEVVLAAPDVARSDFERMARGLGRFIRGGITLYASSRDKALTFSKAYAGGRVRAGDVPKGGPVVVAGVDTIDISDLSSSIFYLNHAAFADRSPLVEDMARLFRSSTRPPSERWRAFKPDGTQARRYWRYQSD